MSAIVDIFSTDGDAVTGEQIQATIECGQHSGIPDCCILFFIGVWRWMSERERERYGCSISRVFDYVPCATCSRLNVTPRQPVLDCPAGCSRTRQNVRAIVKGVGS